LWCPKAPEPEDELFPAAVAADVGVIVRVPFDEGSLTDKISPETTFPHRDFRNLYFSGDRKEQVWDRAQAIAKDLGAPMDRLPEIALRYCLRGRPSQPSCWPDWDFKTPVAETLEVLVGLQAEGKIRHIGLPNYDTTQLLEALAVHHADSLQPSYNLVDRSAEVELLPYCQAHGVGVVVYSPLMNGLQHGPNDRRGRRASARAVLSRATASTSPREVTKRPAGGRAGAQPERTSSSNRKLSPL
jgi:aryl-alcohol dehydrogenase-like predicted oxidoreductase